MTTRPDVDFRLRIGPGAGLLAALCGTALALSVFPVVDNDVWWHLAVGRALVEHGGFPARDLFSHTAADAPWDRHEWLFGLTLHGLFTWGGISALVLGKAAMLTLTAALVWLACRRAAADLLPPADRDDVRPAAAATAVGFAVVMAMRSFALERPQIVSFAGFSALLLLLQARTPTLARARIPCAAGMAVWVNFHSGAAVGILLAALFLVAELWRGGLRLSLPGGSRARALAVLLAVLSVAFLANPLGPRMAQFPIEAFGGRVNFPRIQEWQPPELSVWRWFSLLLAASWACVAARVLTRKAGLLRAEEVLLLLAFTPPALLYRRHAAFFLLACAPVVSRHAPDLLVSLVSVLRARAAPFRAGFAGMLGPPAAAHPGKRGGTAAVLCLVAMTYAIGSGMIRREILAAGIARARFPVRIADFLERERPAGRLFNLYDWGGYLLYRLHPRTKVFIDGRLVLYGGVVRDYFQIQDGGDRWAELLDRHAVTLAAVNHDYLLAVRLATSPAWKLVHVDEAGAVYAKDVPEHAALIARRAYRAIHPDSPTLCEAEHAAAALAELDRALEGDPGSARLHYYRGQVLHQLSRVREGEDEMRLAISYNRELANAYPFLAAAAESRGEFPRAAGYWRRLFEITGDPEALARARSSARSPRGAPAAPADVPRGAPGERPAAPRVPGGPASAPVESRRATDAGLALARKGDTAAAEREWRRAVELDPDNQVAWTNLGGARLTLGDFDGSVSCFRRAMRADPRFAAAPYNLGWAYETRGRLSEAEKHYRLALEIDPRFEAASAGLDRLRRRPR